MFNRSTTFKIFTVLLITYLLSACSVVDEIETSLAKTVTFENQFSIKLDKGLFDISDDDTRSDNLLVYSDDEKPSTTDTWVSVYSESLLVTERDMFNSSSSGEDYQTDTLDYYTASIRERWDLEDAEHDIIDEQEVMINGKRAKILVYQEKNWEYDTYAVMVTIKGEYDMYCVLSWCPMANDFFEKRACYRMAQSINILGPSTEHEQLMKGNAPNIVTINDQYSLDLKSRFTDASDEDTRADKLLVYKDTSNDSWIVVYSEPLSVTTSDMAEESNTTEDILDYYTRGIRKRWDVYDGTHTIKEQKTITVDGKKANLLIHDEESAEYDTHSAMLTFKSEHDIYCVLSWCPLADDDMNKNECLEFIKTIKVLGPSKRFKRISGE